MRTEGLVPTEVESFGLRLLLLNGKSEERTPDWAAGNPSGKRRSWEEFVKKPAQILVGKQLGVQSKCAVGPLQSLEEIQHPQGDRPSGVTWETRGNLQVLSQEGPAGEWGSPERRGSPGKEAKLEACG